VIFRLDPPACAGRHAAAGPCPSCGRVLEAGPERRLYCSPVCRRQVARLPHGEREQRRASTRPGVCAACGAPVEPVVFWRCPRGRRNGLWRMRRVAGGPVRFNAEAFDWLAGKLRLEPSDARLPELALVLADAGELHALVARSGAVIALAKAQERGG
jgi:hypothetical protein